MPDGFQGEQGEQVAVASPPQEPVAPELAAGVALDGPGPESGNGVDPLRSRPGRGWWALRIGIGLAGLAILAVALVFAISRLDRSASAGPVPNPTPGPTSGRVPFEFSLTSITTESFNGKLSRPAARRAGEQARVILSTWYDAAYFDPASWKAGPPASAWSLFAPAVARRAEADAGALRLGPVQGLTKLEQTRARLYVRVLLDPSLHPVAMVATVTLEATGSLEGGDLLEVSSHASFLFRIQDGRWRVVAYPSAKTNMNEVPAPSPTPVAGPTASASASA